MGLIVYPLFRTPVPDTKPLTSGEFIANEIEGLEEIAADHGMIPLSSFGDQRNVPPDFEGLPWELDEVLGPCDDWFPAAEGKATLVALARSTREEPEVAGRLESPEHVAEELEDLARILEIAEGVGADFRLEMS
jgi:hypothetical protein